MDRDRSAGWEFRRAPHLLLHWQENQLVLHNYAVRRTLPAHALVIDVLRQFDTWRPLGQYLDTVPAAARDSVRRLVHELHRQRLLWRRDEPLSTQERAMDAWDQWNPSAGFFHSASKDVSFIDMDTHLGQLAEQAVTWPMPPALKEYPRARRVAPAYAANARSVSAGTPGATHVAALCRRAARPGVALHDAALDCGRAAVGHRRRRGADRAEDVAIRRGAASDRGLRRRPQRAGRWRQVSITTRPAHMRSSGSAARGACPGSTRCCRRSGGTGTPRRSSCSPRSSSGRDGATTARARIERCCSKQVTSARPSASPPRGSASRRSARWPWPIRRSRRRWASTGSPRPCSMLPASAGVLRCQRACRRARCRLVRVVQGHPDHGRSPCSCRADRVQVSRCAAGRASRPSGRRRHPPARMEARRGGRNRPPTCGRQAAARSRSRRSSRAATQRSARCACERAG